MPDECRGDSLEGVSKEVQVSITMHHAHIHVHVSAAALPGAMQCTIEATA